MKKSRCGITARRFGHTYERELVKEFKRKVDIGKLKFAFELIR